MNSWDRDIFELIEGRLFFSVHSSVTITQGEIDKHKDACSKKFFFSTDIHESYEPFCLDFGPVDLGAVHRFCSKLRWFWSHPRLQNRELVYYTVSQAVSQSHCPVCNT